MASSFFWNQRLHTFDFPCGPVRPTLFEIIVITRLEPIGERYILDLIEDERKLKDISINFKFICKKIYIQEHQGEVGTKVSKDKHIAFLMYWLSSYFIRSLQVIQNGCNLAQAIDFRHEIYLSKFLLASLYKSMDDVVKIYESSKSKIVGLSR